MPKLKATLALGFGLAIFPFTLIAQEAEPTPPCRATEAARALDFWVGSYNVMVGERRAGRNRIESVLDGCAIIEHWRSATGAEGKSLFYYDAREDTWTQVWVTGDTSKHWGLKVKRLAGIGEDGSVRSLSRQKADEGEYLDRTTLEPGENGAFRQLIEISTDGGETWQTTFDALYVPAGH